MDKQNKKKLKDLYKKFEICGSIDIIKNRIINYKKEEIIKNNRNFIFNYSKIKKELEYRLHQLINYIKADKLMEEIVGIYYCRNKGLIYEYYEIKQKLVNLKDEYIWAKFKLKNQLRRK